MSQLTGKIRTIDFSVCCTIKDINGTQKVAICWVTRHLTKVTSSTHTHTHTLASFNPEWYHNEGDAFLCYIVALNRDDTMNIATCH
jgi:hypothetical protein